jgi:multidrug efflux pump
VLGHEFLTLIVTLATFGATVWLYVIIPKGFLPLQDTGLIYAVMEGGQDVSFVEMQRLSADIESTIRKDPDVTGVVSVIGVTPLNATPNAGRLAITLRPRDQRVATVSAIIDRLKPQARRVPGTVVYFQPVQDIQISTRASRAQFQYTLTGTNSDEVNDWAGRLAASLQSSPVLLDVASDAQNDGLRMMIQIDRPTAGRLGVSMQTVVDTLDDAYGQRQISTIYAQANQYRVILEATAKYQSDPNSLSKLYVPASGTQAAAAQTSLTAGASPTQLLTTEGAAQVPLSALAQFKYTTAPLVISHEEQFPAVTISFNLAPNAALSDAVTVISAAEQSIGVPTSVIGSYSGDAAEFGKSLAGEPWLILAAAVTIYIVLGVLYESFIHPLTILSTLPSAGVGALLALMLYGYDLSVIALIGIVLLMGIVKKNAIMMIDFALEAERVQGLSPRDSILQACLLRFRPIMMTTLAALFGALPLALEGGTGSELRNPLGITLVGGLLLSQLLTLYTTPVIYLQMERLKARLVGASPELSQPELDLPLTPEPSQRAAE